MSLSNTLYLLCKKLKSPWNPKYVVYFGLYYGKFIAIFSAVEFEG